MCGITGWVAFDRDLRREEPVLAMMTETMACRGPDDRGTWTARHAALGHRRLAVIDLPGGRQPMVEPTPAGSVALVYSGEVYNYVELRADLRGRGHRFATESDTEVVLRGYLEWGDAVAERLNGMFAFAVWDDRTRRLVLVRDRLGVKPCYYYRTPDGVLFGSEPKAILANPVARRRVTSDGFRELLAFVKTPGHGFWDGMAEVKPGTVVTVDETGQRERHYWRLTATGHTDDRPATVARIRELLEDIVRRQLVADVPRCSLLSGGLDSSVLTAIAARQLAEAGETIRTFAVDFNGQTDNFVADRVRGTADAPYARSVAAWCGTDHDEVVLDPATLADPALRAALIRARDIPSGLGDMDASLYLLFGRVRQHSTVALSGESADEVFGGYSWYTDPKVLAADTFPWLVRFKEYFGDETAILTETARKVLDIETYQRDSYRTALARIERPPGESDAEWRMRTICHLHLTQFMRVLLDRKDRASMAVGLEVRVPFCDHRLVEYAYRTPWALKSFDGREKSLLRAAGADLLPPEVLARRKAPYPSIQDSRYSVQLRDTVRDLLGRPGHPVFELVSHEWLRAWSDVDPPSGDYVGRYGVERVMDLALWLDMYAPVVDLS